MAIRSTIEIRKHAASCAAKMLQGLGTEGDIGTRVWSLTVFFESYICEGSEKTVAPFVGSRAKTARGLKIVMGGKLGMDPRKR